MPLLHVLASLPNALKSFVIISLSDDYIVAKSLSRSFCIFFLFCHLSVCLLWWGIGTDDDGRRHSIFHIQTRDLGIWWMMTNCKGKLFRAPLSSAQCYMSFCLTNGLWPGPVVPRVFLNNLLIFLVDCFMVWCAVAVCHTCYRLRGCFPFAFTVFHRSIRTWNAKANEACLAKDSL